MDKITGRITAIERGNSSISGNPTYWVTIDMDDIVLSYPAGYSPQSREVTFKTANDAAIAYGIHNGMVGLKVTLTVTRAGRITNIETDSVF